MVEWCHPNARTAFSIERREGDSLSVRRKIEVVHKNTGEDTLRPAGLQVGHPEVSRIEGTGAFLASQVKEFLTIGGEDGTRSPAAQTETRQGGKALRGNLPVAVSVVEPDTPLPDSMRGHERLAVRSNRDALLFGGAESDLLRRAFRKALPPNVEIVAEIGAEIHPFAIRRPARVRALALPGTGDFTGRASVKGKNPTGHPSDIVHFGNEDPLSVRR